MAMESWNFDLTHSSVNFWVRHLMVSKVHGRFQKWSGTLEFDEKNPSASRVAVEIDASSIDTKEAQRDAHLRSPDFLDTDKFPKIAFKSTKVTPKGDGFDVLGDLSIHGVTKPVTLAVEFAGRVKDPWGGVRAGFSAHVKIDRREFGLTWNKLLEAGGLTVGDHVDVNLEIEAVQVVEAAKVAAPA